MKNDRSAVDIRNRPRIPVPDEVEDLMIMMIFEMMMMMMMMMTILMFTMMMMKTIIMFTMMIMMMMEYIDDDFQLFFQDFIPKYIYT